MITAQQHNGLYLYIVPLVIFLCTNPWLALSIYTPWLRNQIEADTVVLSVDQIVNDQHSRRVDK